MSLKRNSSWCKNLSDCWKAEGFKKSIEGFRYSGEKEEVELKERQYKIHCNHNHKDCSLYQKSRRKL